MSIKTYRPVTKSLRQMTRINYRDMLSGHKPHKPLLKGAKRHGGRNSQGRITVRHQGGGHKQRHRNVDFTFDKKNVPARISSIEYDPMRSAFIGLAVYRDGDKRYVVLPQKMKVGDEFIVSENAPIKIGNRLQLGNVPVGTFVYNIEIKPGNGGKIARSAGNFCEVIAQEGGYANLKMPSTEVRRVIGTCWATVGEASNQNTTS